MAGLVAGFSLSVTAVGQAKSSIDYLTPAPFVHSPLSSARSVLTRDICSRIESARATLFPGVLYWDGTILKTTDGKYHVFIGTRSGSIRDGLALTCITRP